MAGSNFQTQSDKQFGICKIMKIYYGNCPANRTRQN